MTFSSEAIYILRIIAEAGSFCEAAKKLHRVPSAVSYMVKKLEDELGVCLFNRDGKQISPTAATQHIITQGEWILQGVYDLKRHAIQLSTGIEPHFTIALNYIMNPHPITDLLRELAIRFPVTEFSIRTEVYNGCWDALYEDRADFVIGAPQNPPWPDDISTEPMGKIGWVFVVAKDHPVASIDGILRADLLRNYPSVVVHDSSVALQPKKTWALRGQKMIYAADLTMAKNLIANGIGIGFLPERFISDPLTQERIVVKQISEHKHPIAINYAWKTHSQSSILKFIVEYLVDEKRKEEWLK
ncbi:LysR substrate-binding domain-containing protein [Mannheimia sp. AT1]|uniref:LysR substrate-binding domain-containing protein n=1 Tax=Mannheimia cairinae TaxID=3025936 RepID=A0ABT5MTQ9_9PAST|nr:LysR substrate-binding domain-containing protein [Mannheimia cairinae]MDD0824287.1 LysR substrate-binding domain-containing protein [Mannheimia cairinae]MDD0826590.1 LysR substrate-binding domain-containing protein [Mannheimia cairinae]